MAKIILVEDDQMLAEIYQTRLQLAGYECLIANDGMTGLLLIKEHLPDLVLLDLMLPQISGDDILREMRKHDWGKDIKAIFLTNISESEAPEGLEELGFERYIVKANLANNQLAEIVAETLASAPTK
ncbi:MAG TPA: response regulator [Candidatus Saccharimonadales bacterium]|nr:response regulator [Candidatus Saccharimonadales bacterium]